MNDTLKIIGIMLVDTILINALWRLAESLGLLVTICLCFFYNESHHDVAEVNTLLRTSCTYSIYFL